MYLKVICPIIFVLFFLPFFSSSTFSQDFDFSRISNDIAFYRNVDDDLKDKGWTLQLVLINSVKIGTEFQFEFTADFNRDLAWRGKDDYYIEVGMLKEICNGFSVNYQRIEGTFQPGGVNQIGLRYHF